MKQNRIIIYYAVILQFITALFIFTSLTPIRVASLGVFYELFKNHYIGALTLFASVILAGIGLYMKESKFRFLFFIPQYLLLLLTAGSSINYVIQGQYADGVVRPPQFIFLDQLPSLIIVVLYTIGIFDFRKKPNDR